MKKAHYEKEKLFWDSKTEGPYSVLSEYDASRVSKWLDWQYGGAILDIGGGSGAASDVVSSKQKSWVVCLDISYELLRYSSNTKVQGDALLLPFEDNSFDLVIAAAFIHHLPGLENELIHECFRVLKPGGTFFGYDPNAHSFQNRIFMRGGALRLNVFSPDERPIFANKLGQYMQDAGFESYVSEYFSMRYKDMSIFEFIQRYLINPFAFFILKRYLHRWFFWLAKKKSS